MHAQEDFSTQSVSHSVTQYKADLEDISLQNIETSIKMSRTVESNVH